MLVAPLQLLTVPRVANALLATYVWLCFAFPLHLVAVRHTATDGCHGQSVSCCLAPQLDYCQTCAGDPASEAFRHAPDDSAIHECPFRLWLHSLQSPLAAPEFTFIGDLPAFLPTSHNHAARPAAAALLLLAPKQSPPA